ncbi:protein of unknown function [Ralstonia solanacearum CMR15]|nr:protein of unknown function [Ralstonia solanacearum CMR15]
MFGRFIASTKCAGAPRLSTCPIQIMASIRCHASAPPRAAAFFATICSTEGMPAVLGPVSPAQAERHAASAHTAIRLIMAIPRMDFLIGEAVAHSPIGASQRARRLPVHSPSPARW